MPFSSRTLPESDAPGAASPGFNLSAESGLPEIVLTPVGRLRLDPFDTAGAG